MKVNELLTDKTKWAQHKSALNALWMGVLPESHAAVRWCLIGAMLRCYPEPKDYYLVSDKIYGEIGQEKSISVWNDVKGRKFSEVRDLVVKLDV